MPPLATYVTFFFSFCVIFLNIVALPTDLTPTMGALVFNPNDRTRVRTIFFISDQSLILPSLSGNSDRSTDGQSSRDR